MTAIIFFLIAFLASIAGSLSGIGGGVIVKPVVDALGLASLAQISFLSGAMVLAMATVNVVRSLRGQQIRIDWRRSALLAAGSIAGGWVGNRLFLQARLAFGQDAVVGIIQAILLLLMTVGVLLYTLGKDRLRRHSIQSPVIILAIGLGLGLISAFLGIGGGPMNIAAISFLLGLSSKETALNSLFVIFCSQLVSLVTTVASAAIPVFEPQTLLLMIVGGIAGALIGGQLLQRISERQVDRFFIGMLGLIALICLYNVFRYASVLRALPV